MQHYINEAAKIAKLRLDLISSFLYLFRPVHQPHQRGPPIIRNKNPYPEFQEHEEIYQPQTRYEELPRLAPPLRALEDGGTKNYSCLLG